MNEARELIRGYVRRLLMLSMGRDLGKAMRGTDEISQELLRIPASEAEQTLVEAKLPTAVWAMLVLLYLNDKYKTRNEELANKLTPPDPTWLLYVLIVKAAERATQEMAGMDATESMKFAKSFDMFKPSVKPTIN